MKMYDLGSVGAELLMLSQLVRLLLDEMNYVKIDNLTDCINDIAPLVSDSLDVYEDYLKNILRCDDAPAVFEEIYDHGNKLSN